jgi:phytoene synthase
MQDAFAHCEQLVRAADKDRFLATLFAPAERRGALHALYAFNVEVARVRDIARVPLPGEIRLQWWSEVLRGERDGEASANPVAAALRTAIERYRLTIAALEALIEARRFDLYDDPMATVADLESYADKTSSTLIAMAAAILGTNIGPSARPAGIAYAVAGLLRAFPVHAARGQLFVPLDLLQRHGADPQDIFAGRTSPGLRAALGELRALARCHLAAVDAAMADLPPQAVPALLPVASVRPMLDRLDRGDPFQPPEIPPWRRQWLIWRAARNPQRIAGR